MVWRGYDGANSALELGIGMDYSILVAAQPALRICYAAPASDSDAATPW